MVSYFLKCKKTNKKTKTNKQKKNKQTKKKQQQQKNPTKNINPVVSKTSNGRTMILSKCAICGSKKSKFIKKQEAKGLLSNLVIRTLLSKIPIF